MNFKAPTYGIDSGIDMDIQLWTMPNLYTLYIYLKNNSPTMRALSTCEYFVLIKGEGAHL